MNDGLSKDELHSHDDRPMSAGGQHRFLCPRCGEGKKQDNAHRSLVVDPYTERFICHRCHLRGKLDDAKARQESEAEKEARVKRAEAEMEARDNKARQVWVEQTKRLEPIFFKRDSVSRPTPASIYLRKRAIREEVMTNAQIKFSSNWMGRMAAVFPVRGASGELVGAQGRYTNKGNPRMRTIRKPGTDSGVFMTPDCWEGMAIVITEAPIDALSLFQVGLPTIATCGTSLPQWVIDTCATMGNRDKRVIIATDNDEGGDAAFDDWVKRFSRKQISLTRLRPEPHKDWNDFLQKSGEVAMKDFIENEIGIKL